MDRQQPKKYITSAKLVDREMEIGLARRKSYAKTITHKAPIIPKPIEYEDIDNAMYEFAENELSLVIDNKKIPTYKSYSIQGQSEIRQYWDSVDDEKNPYINFKTISRERNPQPGTNQGMLKNIPGNYRTTLLMRTVMENNGDEVYEIHSMGQPVCVNLTYRISFITNKIKNLNLFNYKVINLFKSIQSYIRVNGRFIKLTLDSIDDKSEMSISSRKCLQQTAVIKAEAYIQPKESFEVKKVPKQINLFMEGDVKRPKPKISIEEYYDNKIDYQTIDLSIEMEPYHTTVEFDIDTDFVIETIELDNIDSIRVSVNEVPFYIDKGFEVNNNDNIKIFIKHSDPSISSHIKMIGYNPSKPYIKDNLPLKTSDDIIKHEDVSVE